MCSRGEASNFRAPGSPEQAAWAAWSISYPWVLVQEVYRRPPLLFAAVAPKRATRWLQFHLRRPVKRIHVAWRVSGVPIGVRGERCVRLCGLEVRPYYTLVADAPPRTAPKKIPTPEPKFAVVAISHVKGEFRYGSGMVELCLYDFNGPSPAFFGVPHFSVIPPTVIDGCPTKALSLIHI